MPLRDYILKPDSEILEDINNGTVPDSVLADDEGWREICAVRGRNFSSVDADSWRELCRDRGYAKRNW